MEIVGTEREDSVRRRVVLSLEGKTCGCWTKFLLNIIMTDRGIRLEYKAGHSEYFLNMLRCYLHQVKIYLQTSLDENLRSRSVGN